MFRRTLLIAFALCLAYPTPGGAQPPPARATPQDEAGTNVVHPLTFVCPPKSNPNPPHHPIPPGKNIDDLCPPGTSPLLFLGPADRRPPGTMMYPGTFACFPQMHQQPRPVPPGKTTDFDDLCPAGTPAWLFPYYPPLPQPDTGKRAP